MDGIMSKLAPTSTSSTISSLFPKEAEGGRRDLEQAGTLVKFSGPAGAKPRGVAAKLAPIDWDEADCPLGRLGHPSVIPCPEP